MSLTITIDSVDVTDKVRLENLRFNMKARQGEVGTGTLDTDDTTGAADYAPLATQWEVTESDATPTIIAGGFVAERAIDRGPLSVSTQRQFAPVLEDWNTHLTDRVFGGAQAKRPEETDYERVMWLLSTDKLGLLGGDGQVPDTNTVTMDPTDYRGKTPLDVLDDCGESANKNFFVYYDSDIGDWCLYYDKIGSTEAAFSSDLYISDLDTDIDSSTTFGASDISYVEDPERIYSGLLVKWANGWVYKSDSDTEDDYRRLQRTVIKENIRTASRARAWATRQLEKLNEPTKRLSLTVSVPGSALGELRAGYRIRVKLRARGITAYTYFRIESTEIRPREGRRGVSDVEYDVRLKMVDKVRPVNLDDTYAGGDSSGGQSTGGSIGVINDGSGTVGDGSTSTDYVMDDFARIIGTPLEVDDAVYGNSTITTAVVNLPDGVDVAGRMVVIWGVSDTDLDVHDGLVSTHGFTSLLTATPGTNHAYVVYRITDGTEGWSATGQTLTVSGITSQTVTTYAICHDRAQDIEGAKSATDDPPSLNPSWAEDTRTLWYTFCADDTSLAGTPTGFSSVAAGGATPWWSLDSKEDDAQTEDPSTYTGGGNSVAFTIALQGYGDVDTWGAILEGGGVDTEAPWEGGNEYALTVVSGAADTYVDDGSGHIVMTSDDTEVQALLTSDTVDTSSDEPWGPWASGDAEYLMRWKVDPVGDTADSDANLLEVTITAGGDLAVVFRIHLGDGASYSYQSGSDERGIVIIQSLDYSDFIPKTISSDTWYLTRMDFRGTRAKMRLWEDGTAEPVAWDLDVAKVDTGSLDLGESLLTASGNDGMHFYIDSIDATLGSSGGGAVVTSLPPGDGSTTTWYVDPWVGGIIVFVDGIRTAPASFDRDAGTFTFDRAPANGASIRAEYTPR